MIFQKAIVCTLIDGDTVEVKLDNGRKERVRFIGINCLESTLQQGPYGKEASEYTKNMLLGKTIYLEKDISDRDIYGGLLRYVWVEVPRSTGESEIRGKMFNAILLIRGYAEVAAYMHLHVHLIPRYKVDVENPRGGIRHLKQALVEYDG